MADVHANLSALEAVLRDLDGQGADMVINLGDVVGYNGEPAACIDAVREASDVVLAGNHDWGVGRRDEATGTSSTARAVQDWTRRTVSPSAVDYLASLPNIVVSDQFVAVHGCFLNRTHVTGYVTTTMLAANLAAVSTASQWAPLAFCGHSHLPIAGFRRGDEVAEPRWNDVFEWPEAADAVLINPGAVGQPRDRDPRAAYALVDTTRRRAVLRRVEYDIAATARANQNAGLPGEVSDRLWEGR